MASKRFFLFSAATTFSGSPDAHGDISSSVLDPDQHSTIPHHDSASSSVVGQLAVSGYFHIDATWGLPLEITPMDNAYGRYGPR